jgi:ABC-type cobalamin/Fe3+-siderophores transport system ATPase subunit
MDDDPGQRRRPLVGVVGPCCAGKTTLVNGLNVVGIPARVIAQEHSYVPHMWQAITGPDLLIYLDVSYPVAQQRRWMNWMPADLEEQHYRLRHARAHCNLYMPTDDLTRAQVLDRALAFVASQPGLPAAPVV